MRKPARRTRRKSAPKDDEPRLIGYARVSTDEQAREGMSLEAQRDRLTFFAKAHGLDLVRVATDPGVSGATPPTKREGLSGALQDVRDGRADGIVVVKLDRLSRRVRDTLDLMDESRRDGWRLVSVGEALDTGTAAGRMVLTVLSALAEWERDTLRERTKEGMAVLARHKVCRSRFVPFGYSIVGFPGVTDLSTVPEDERPKAWRLTEDRDEQDILRDMYDLYEHGHGAQRIAKALNEDARPNPRTGGRWTTSNVATILRNARNRLEAMAGA